MTSPPPLPTRKSAYTHPTHGVVRQGINEGMADEWLSLTTRKAVGKGGSELPPSTRKIVEARALEWVRHNRGMLPRLALPQPGSHAGGVRVNSGGGAVEGGTRK